MSNDNSALQRLLQSVTEQAHAKSALSNDLKLLTNRCEDVKNEANNLTREVEEKKCKIQEVESSNAELRERCETLRRTTKSEISNKSSFRLTLKSLQQRHDSLEKTLNSKLDTQEGEIRAAEDLNNRSLEVFSGFSEDREAMMILCKSDPAGAAL